MSKRSGVDIETTIYNKFKGVDFTTDPSLVDSTRSPWATNIIADEGGMPEKRMGYRIFHTLPDSTIEGGIDRKILGMGYAGFRRDAVSNITYPSGATVTVTAKTVYDKYGKTGTYRIALTMISSSLYCSIWAGRTLETLRATADATGLATIVSSLTERGIVTTGLTVADAVIIFVIEHDNSYRHYIAVVKGKAIYRWYESTSPEIIYQDTSTLEPQPDFTCATFAFLKDKLLIFTGEQAFIYDGSTITNLTSNPYVPITIIGRTPSGGGDTYEGVNYLTGKQEIRAMGDGSSTVYTLPYAPVDAVNKVVVNGTEKTVTTDYTVDLTNGTVTFTSAPSTPSVSGQDNVYITFTHKTDGYAERITHCTIATVWGVGGASDRIVLSGNPAYPNQDFICGYEEPTYWSDKNYSVVGTSQTAILGYRRMGEQLAIIKEDNGQDSSIFFRTGELDDDGEAVFTVKATIGGAGAVSQRGFGNIGNEQMYLTGNGVYAITTNYLTAEKIVQNRSKRVDPQLIKEDLSGAMVAVYKDKFMVFVDGKVYGLDGTQDKSYMPKSYYDYVYECFYWEDVPANCVMRTVTNGEESLYFGDTSGYVYKFNTDIDTIYKYSDERPVTFTATAALTETSYDFIYDGSNWTLDGETVTLSTYGITAPTSPKETARIEITKVSNVYYAHYYTPIEAVWATPADDDGDAMVYKTLLKKGNAITIKPYQRSSCEIYMRTDKDSVEWIGNSGTMDVFNWEDIDFERFTFNSNDAPQEIAINRKVKNYKRLQIIAKNAVTNEGFGVYGITKHYVTGNFAKR